MTLRPPCSGNALFILRRSAIARRFIRPSFNRQPSISRTAAFVYKVPGFGKMEKQGGREKIWRAMDVSRRWFTRGLSKITEETASM